MGQWGIRIFFLSVNNVTKCNLIFAFEAQKLNALSIFLFWCISGGLVFAAFDQVPHDLHDNVIVLGCLSFFVSLLILIDLADPMARHTSDTTQTENNNINGNGNIVSINASSPLKIPNGGIEAKQINRITTLQPTETSIQVHDVHEDSRSENHSPAQSNVNIALNGNYHRSDEVDFVQTKILPRAEQPVFEKVLLPEKRRPEKQNIQNPRENTSQTEFIPDRINDQRQTAYDQRQTTNNQMQNAFAQRQTAYDHRQTSNDQMHDAYDQRQAAYDHRHTTYDQNNFSHQDQYLNIDSRSQPHQNYGYVRDNMHATRRQPSSNQQQFSYDNRPLMVIRDYSNSKANMTYDQRINSASHRRNNNFNNHSVRKKSQCRSHCSSDDDENVSSVQPGFVANAAKIWDNRARNDFNTVV